MTTPVTPPRRARSLWRLLGSLTALTVVPVFVAVIFTTVVTGAIWPGEAKFTAPLLCPDDKTDAFVVVDQESVRAGETSYNFSLYCMGPRGEVEEVGFLQPFLVLSVVHAGVLLGVALVLWLAFRIRRSTRGGGGPDVVPGEL